MSRVLLGDDSNQLRAADERLVFVGRSPFPIGWIDGFAISRTGTTELSVGTGGCVDGEGNHIWVIDTTTAIDASQNGAVNRLDTGTLVADTIYYVWSIAQAEGAAPGFLLSASDSAPTLPSGYIYERLIGSWKTNGSAEFYEGVYSRLVNGGIFTSWEPMETYLSAGVDSSFTAVAPTVPTTAVAVLTFASLESLAPSPTQTLRAIYSVDGTNSYATIGHQNETTLNHRGHGYTYIPLDSSGEHYYRTLNTDCDVTLQLLGWEESL